MRAIRLLGIVVFFAVYGLVLFAAIYAATAVQNHPKPFYWLSRN